MTHIHGLYYGTLGELNELNERMKKEECQIRLLIPLDVITKKEFIGQIVNKLPCRHNNIVDLIMKLTDNIIVKRMLDKYGIKIIKDESQFSKNNIWIKSPTFTIFALRDDGITPEGVECL